MLKCLEINDLMPIFAAFFLSVIVMEDKDFIRKIELSYGDLRLLKSAFLGCHERLSCCGVPDLYPEHALQRLEYFIGVLEACFDSLEGMDVWPTFSCSIKLLK